MSRIKQFIKNYKYTAILPFILVLAVIIILTILSEGKNVSPFLYITR